MKKNTQYSHELETTKPNSQLQQHTELSEEQLRSVWGGSLVSRVKQGVEQGVSLVREEISSLLENQGR